MEEMEQRPPAVVRADALARVIDAKLSLDWAMLRFRWAVADAAVAGVPVLEIDQWTPAVLRRPS